MKGEVTIRDNPPCGDCGKPVYDYYRRWQDTEAGRVYFHDSEGTCVENLKAERDRLKNELEAVNMTQAYNDAEGEEHFDYFVKQETEELRAERDELRASMRAAGELVSAAQEYRIAYEATLPEYQPEYAAYNLSVMTHAASRLLEVARSVAGPESEDAL
jgi:hypothetical protein